MAKNHKKTAAEHKADIQRWKKEIEQEEAFTGSRWDAEVRQVLNMTDEELEQSIIEDELELEKIEKAERIKQAQHRAQQDALVQQQELERLTQLAGIRDGAAREAQKRVKKLADKQIQRVLKR